MIEKKINLAKYWYCVENNLDVKTTNINIDINSIPKKIQSYQYLYIDKDKQGSFYVLPLKLKGKLNDTPKNNKVRLKELDSETIFYLKTLINEMEDMFLHNINKCLEANHNIEDDIVDYITSLKKGVSIKRLANKYNLGVCELRDFIKNSDELVLCNTGELVRTKKLDKNIKDNKKRRFDNCISKLSEKE